jgi:organic radical activating enzyme
MISESKTFCVLPWIHLAAYPNGMASLCCISDHTEYKNMARNSGENAKPLSLNGESINTMLNSDFFKTTRLQMLNNEIPSACKRCFEEESNGKRSKRQEEMNRFDFNQKRAALSTQADGSIPLDLKFVELRLGNLCNVKCRTCNPGSSSKWSAEYQVMQKDLDFVEKHEKMINCSWTESDAFWEDLLFNSKNIELIYINGGEPTLVEKHWQCLERLIEKGHNKNMTLWYNINMTHLPEKLISLWSKFKKVIVFASIDDLYERNSYIRSGSDWNEVIKNLDILQSHKWIETSICQTVNWMNIYYLDEFYAFMKARGLDVHLNLVYNPGFLDPVILSRELKDIVLKKITTIDSWKYDYLKNHLSSEGNNSLFSNGLNYNNYLDKTRNQSFKETFSEWSALIEKNH